MLFRMNHFLGTDNRRVAIMLFIVAFTGGLRIFFIFTSFARLPLGDSTTILFSSPVIVMVLSMFILHERCGIFRMVAATTLLGGVILISKPPFIFGHDENLGYDAIGKTVHCSETERYISFIFPILYCQSEIFYSFCRKIAVTDKMLFSGYSLVLCACGMSALGIVLTKLISKQVM